MSLLQPLDLHNFKEQRRTGGSGVTPMGSEGAEPRPEGASWPVPKPIHLDLCFPFIDCQTKLPAYGMAFCNECLTITANRTTTSASRRLLMVMPCRLMPMRRSWIAKLITNSSRMLKSCGYKMQPCLTPVRVLKHSVMLSSTLTAFVEIW